MLRPAIWIAGLAGLELPCSDSTCITLAQFWLDRWRACRRSLLRRDSPNRIKIGDCFGRMAAFGFWLGRNRQKRSTALAALQVVVVECSRSKSAPLCYNAHAAAKGTEPTLKVAADFCGTRPLFARHREIWNPLRSPTQTDDSADSGRSVEKKGSRDRLAGTSSESRR